MENERPDFELVMSPSAPITRGSYDHETSSRLTSKIDFAGLLFNHFRFSQIGVPPGTTENILAEPERYWRKKIDGDRKYYIPLGPLKSIHDAFAHFLEHLGRIHSCFPATAYWKGSSIIGNAQPHRHNSSALCLDATDAFQSIKAKHIARYLLRSGIMLYGPHHYPPRKDPYRENQWGRPVRPDTRYDRSQAWIISRLLTYRGRLRLGSSASPFIFNLLLERLDRAMQEKLKAFPDMVYTRYADDFGFSAEAAVFPQTVERAVREVLHEHHVVVNEKKTRRSSNGILEFPGVVIVHGKVRPTGEYILALAQMKYLSDQQRRGHKNFLHQFGRGGVPKILKALVR